MRWFTRFSLRNGSVILIAMLMVIAGGIYSYVKIPNAEYPSVDIPYVNVLIGYPGATPEQVYNDIGKLLEPKLETISGLQNLYSYSSTGQQVYTLEVSMDRKNSDVDRDIQDVINQVTLPSSAAKPIIQNQSIAGDSIYTFSVSSPHANLQTIQDYVQNTLKPALSSLQGVGDVQIHGMGTKDIFVQVNPAKMKAMGVTWQQVQQALVANNFSSPIGTLQSNQQSMPIVVTGHARTLKDIANIPIVLLKPDTSSLTNAFTSVQSGFAAVGNGMQTMGKNQAIMQGEIQYMAAIQGLTAQLMSESAQLQSLQSKGVLSKNPAAATAIRMQMGQTSQEIRSLQQRLASLQNQLRQPSGAASAASGGSLAAAKTSISPTQSGALGGLTVQAVRLGSIADVVYRQDSNTAAITRTDGQPGVMAMVIPAQNANTVQVVHDVKQTLAKTVGTAGYQWHELSNASTTIQQSVSGMMREALLGALLAAIVTLLFLRDLRATLVALCSIPLSIFAAVSAMYAMGYSLNILTLSGIAVAVGRVVDDSIVVIENVYRRLRMQNGEKGVKLLDEATHEVGAAVTSSTITTIAVFFPMTLVPGIVGHIFVPFAWTVIIALAFSLLVALMVVPTVAKWSLLHVKSVDRPENGLQRIYRRILRWSLSHKWIVILISLALMAESGFAITKVGFNFLPADRVQIFDVNVTMPMASTLAASNQVDLRVEKTLAGMDGIKTYESVIEPSGSNVYVSVKDSVKNTDALAAQLRARLKFVTGAHRITVSGNNGPADSNIALVLQGPNYPELVQAAKRAYNALTKVPGLADVTTSVQATMPQVDVNVDSWAAARYGLDPTQVAGLIHSMVNGTEVETVSFEGRDTTVNLQLGNGNIPSVNDLRNQLLTTATGHEVRLSQIAHVSVADGPTAISRLNQQPYVQINGTIVADNQGAVTTKVNQAMKNLNLSNGITITQEGASQEMNQGFKNIGLAMLAGFFLVLMVMLVTFRNWSAPLSIVFALPFAMVGGMNSLWIAKQPLGMPGMIGFMMLIGIIVTNAIVLMDRVERNMRQGMGVREALLEAGVVRLRPILMTATATIGALLPLSLTTGAGLISKTLAIVVIGGLLISTLLTLVIVPIMFDWFVGIRRRVYGHESESENELTGLVEP